jgi:hypothetical protein
VENLQRHLRSVAAGDEAIAPAVEETIAALELKAIDAGAVQLARRYAAVIDEAGDMRARASAMRWIAPQLLDVLESLGATPAARSRLKGGTPANAAPTQLDRLRQARGRTA